MKSVMISIKPYWVFLIIAKTMGWNIDKEKTVEVRKTYPRDDEWDKVGKIYCTKDKKSFNHIPKKYQPFMEKFLGKVIGEFVCDRIDTIRKRGIDDNFDYCYLSLDKWGNDDIEPEITAVKNSCVLRDDLNDYSACFGYGVAPVCLFSSEILKSSHLGIQKPNQLGGSCR